MKRFIRAAGAMLLVAAMLFMVACGGSSSSASGQSSQAPALKDGAYEVTVDAHNGPMTVVTTIAGGVISNVEVTDHSETPDIGGAALPAVTEDIIAGNTLDIDTVAGATVTTEAVKEAVAEAIRQAGGDPADYSAARSGETVTLAADIVIVGAGASGVSAAVAAAEAGATVILIEKTGVIGGASNLSWAGKMVNSTAAMADENVVDEEEMINDWIVDCHWRVDAAAIRQYVTRSGETYDWLNDHGYELTYMNFGGEQMHLLPDYATREDILRTMLANSVEAGGGQVLTNTTGRELMVDESGAVVGVIADRNDGAVIEVTAKAVIIATGGYGANFDMVAEEFGFRGVNGGLTQNVGEGLEMAWAAGAAVPDNFGGQMLHQTLAAATADLRAEFEPFEACYPLMTTYLPNFMNVGSSGSRFRDETATLTAVAAANTSAFQGPYHYVIVSQDMLDTLAAQGMNGIGAPRLPGMPPEFYADFRDDFTLDNPWVNATEIFDAMVANGDGFVGDTPEALAEAAGMDVDTFVAQFEAYQQACETGVDPQFNKPAEYLVPLGNGPYYAVKAEINNLGSIGGLLVNTQFQVLNADRVPVPGLYAVGAESEGVLFNDTYVGNGVGIGYAFTSGRLGGEYAASNVA